MRGHNNFDRIASFYDQLSNLIFGDSIKRAQTHFLKDIRPGAAVLIVGGGTGWIIEEIFSRTANCSVWFVERSHEMIKRASRYDRPGSVHIIQGTVKEMPQQKFDAVITNFYLDLFPDEGLDDVIREIAETLKPDAIWLASDFVSQKWWHRLMLWVMYRFFRAACRIEARSLPGWQGGISRMGYRQADYHFFYGSFIKSVLYTPQPSH